MSSRAGSADASGTANGMPAVTILRLPRVSRAAIVGSGTRKSRAMSAVVTPTTSRSASALATSGARAGWQHISTRRSTSSSTRSPGSARTEPDVAAASASTTSSGTLRAAIASARSRSSTRRRAAVMQPRRGPLRDAVARPGARGRLHGVGEGVLDEVEAAELREEEGDEAPPLLAHRRREGVVRRHCGSYPSILITGRISTVYAGGSSEAAAIAASRSGRRRRRSSRRPAGALGEGAIGDGAGTVGARPHRRRRVGVAQGRAAQVCPVLVDVALERVVGVDVRLAHLRRRRRPVPGRPAMRMT